MGFYYSQEVIDVDDIYSKRPKYSCKDCTKRYPGCHSKCEEYLAAKTRRDEARKKRYDESQGYTTALTKERWMSKNNIRRP